MEKQWTHSINTEAKDTWRRAMSLIAQNYHRLKQLEQVDHERYVRSFLKQRVLSEWKKVRRTIPYHENRGFWEAWEKMKLLLYYAFKEDHDQYSFTSLYWWIIGQKDTAESLGRHDEASLWGEMERWIGERKNQDRFQFKQG